jgi:hypothetical protein
MADNLTTFKCRLSRNLGASTSWNPQSLSRPVQACNGTALPLSLPPSIVLFPLLPPLFPFNPSSFFEFNSRLFILCLPVFFNLFFTRFLQTLSPHSSSSFYTHISLVLFVACLSLFYMAYQERIRSYTIPFLCRKLIRILKRVLCEASPQFTTLQLRLLFKHYNVFKVD